MSPPACRPPVTQAEALPSSLHPQTRSGWGLLPCPHVKTSELTCCPLSGLHGLSETVGLSTYRPGVRWDFSGQRSHTLPI